jgi:hypothetical protein
MVAACSTRSALPKLPAQARGTLGNYVLADGVRTNVAHATGYRFSRATIADAQAVARAFGVGAEPKADNRGWSFGPYDTTVEGVQPPSAYVAANGRFQVRNDRGVAHSGQACPNPAGDGAVVCGVPPTTLSTVLPAHFTDSDVTAIALDHLRAAGAELPTATVSVPLADGYFFTVDVVGRIGREPVDGYESEITINQDKTITSADGIVTRPKRVGVYPLAPLPRAIARLNAGFGVVNCPPRSLMGLPGTISCGMQPSGRPSEVVTLTSAKVGLMISYDAGHAWLIPAYFLTTAAHTIVVTPAAADRYFATGP